MRRDRRGRDLLGAELTSHRVPPPDLRGRPRPDRLFQVFGLLVTGFEWLTRGAHRWRPPVVAVDRDLHLVVTEVDVVADGVRSFRLALPDGAQLPAWQPGCHLDVVLPSGRRRQYSLCGAPADRESYRIAVRRIVGGGGGSQELHDSVRAGSRLVAQGPRNAFPFVPADRYLFIAGGIGITPILPMVTQAATNGADWRLVYTGRSTESMPFLDELAELARPEPGRVWIRPDTHYGVPGSGAELLAHGSSEATVYCCGPGPLLDAVRRDLPASGASTLHFERFSAAPIRDGVPFEVRLIRSNQVRTVPADRSTLDVIREVCPDVAYSCRQGFCGTCRTRVLSGEVDHRDRILTDSERRDTMTVCVSRASEGQLVLDL